MERVHAVYVTSDDFGRLAGEAPFFVWSSRSATSLRTTPCNGVNAPWGGPAGVRR
jgi:hypothetical protein